MLKGTVGFRAGDLAEVCCSQLCSSNCMDTLGSRWSHGPTSVLHLLCFRWQCWLDFHPAALRLRTRHLFMTRSLPLISRPKIYSLVPSLLTDSIPDSSAFAQFPRQPLQSQLHSSMTHETREIAREWSLGHSKAELPQAHHPYPWEQQERKCTWGGFACTAAWVWSQLGLKAA